MKIAVVYNRDSKSVINLFGVPNREKYGEKSIQRILDGLKKYGHQVKSFEGDKDLIDKLEDFMPRVLKGERPGMVFNLSYGIQGQARYTHVPGILEMVGMPYIGSGPLAHSLALDKVVAKMIFVQNGLPTPEFAVLNDPDFPAPKLKYPLIVKPKNEAVSMGIKIVNNEKELREAAGFIFDSFGQGVLVERFIKGREINVGLIGNNPAEALPPCEIVFGKEGPQIYTIEDKKGKSGREIQWLCPAPISEELADKCREIAVKAFDALGCYDCARVDMRLDDKGNFYILEINSLPSLGEHGSFTIAAQHVGLDFPALLNRLVEVASSRYFGTPTPPKVTLKDKDAHSLVFHYLTERRDLLEKRLEEWSSISSRTSDPLGCKMGVEKMEKQLTDIKMRPVKEFTDMKSVYTWETQEGFEKGTLFVSHIDIPIEVDIPGQFFRRDPEWLYGEGIGISRAPLVMIEFALRALRHNKFLHHLPIGVVCYTDEGRDCRYSGELLREVTSRARRVFILRPGNLDDKIILQRRGQRKYRLTVEGKPQRPGQGKGGASEVLLWNIDKISKFAGLSSKKEKLTISTVDIKTETFPMLLPHRVRTTILVSYLDPKTADKAEEKMREILKVKGYNWKLDQVSDRPPMKERPKSQNLAKALTKVAENWEIPLTQESSLFPSAGGLVPENRGVVCGVGPVAKDLYTPHEAVSRASLVQRTLLMAQYLAREVEV